MRPILNSRISLKFGVFLGDDRFVTVSATRFCNSVNAGFVCAQIEGLEDYRVCALNLLNLHGRVHAKLQDNFRIAFASEAEMLVGLMA